MPQSIRYLNTDLDLLSPVDLAPIVAHLQSAGVYALHVGRRDDGLFDATCEAVECQDNPEASISLLLTAIESLPPAARQDWLALTLREFNIGYDCGAEPWAFNQGLSTHTLRRLADAGATLRITLYPPTETADEAPVT